MPRQNTNVITSGLPCPCCGKPTRREWMQESMMPGRPAHSQTDCLNPECPGYYRTLSVEGFFEQFSTDKKGSAR
jgi:hypothetical protein